MFYVIYIAVIVFALYLIFHDRPKGEPEGPTRPGWPSTQYRPENPGPVPQTPVSPTPKPLEPAPRVAKPVAARPTAPTAPSAPERLLSWAYLYELEYDDEIVGDTLETEITGMRYYCSLADLGPVNGIVQAEPDNPHDPNAQVVIRSDGKKLGYIPRNAIPEYDHFNPDDLVCPFAGYIKVTRQGYMWADILVALPESREFVKEELTAYLDSEQTDS